MQTDSIYCFDRSGCSRLATIQAANEVRMRCKDSKCKKKKSNAGTTMESIGNRKSKGKCSGIACKEEELSLDGSHKSPRLDYR